MITLPYLDCIGFTGLILIWATHRVSYEITFAIIVRQHIQISFFSALDRVVSIVHHFWHYI